MIQINGTAVELAEGTTLQGYLDQNQYNPARVAVERNGAIVPKAAYPSTSSRTATKWKSSIL